MLLQNRAIPTDLLGENILDQRTERSVALSERVEILEGIKAAPDFLAVAVVARQGARHVLELVNKSSPFLLAPRPRAIEQRFWKNRLVEQLLVDFVARIGDDAQRSKDVCNDFVVRQRAPLRQATRNPCIQKSRLERTADPVSSVEYRDVSPSRRAVGS